MRAPLLPLALVLMALAGCVAPGADRDPDGEGGGVASRALAFRDAVVVSQDRPGGEPMLAVGPDGSLFLAGTGPAPAPAGPGSLPGQGVWRSRDGGATWEDVTPALPTGREGGVDNAIAVDAGGTAYYANAAGSTLALFSIPAGGDAWRTLTPIPVPTPMHRMWMVAGPAGVLHLVVEGLDTHNWYHRTDDGGATWRPPVLIHPHTGFGSDLAVDASTGHLHLARIVFGDEPGAKAGWNLWTSKDDGRTWTNRFMLPLSPHLTGSWQALDAGPAPGHLSMVWAEEREGNSQVVFSVSTDGGDSWTAPRPVLPTRGAQTLPWAAPRADGALVVAWYGADARGVPMDLAGAKWWPEATLLRDAFGPSPTGAEPQRLHADPVHEGPICTNGPQCERQGTRDLYDFTWVAVGPDGRAHVAFASSVWDRPGAYALVAGERAVDGR